MINIICDFQRCVVVLGDIKFSAGDYCISHVMRLLQ